MRYAAVGHITIDDFGSQLRVGGSVSYGSTFAAGLGLQSLAVSRVGYDMSEELLRQLEREGVDTSRVKRACERTTRFVIRRGRGFSCPTLLVSKCSDIEVEDLNGLEADVIHLGPVAGEISRDVALKSIKLAYVVLLDLQGVLRVFEERGVRLSGGGLSQFLGIDLVVHLNEDEAAAATGKLDPIECLRELSKHFKVVSISLGSEGALFSFPDGSLKASVPSVEAIDDVGAGDVLTAALGIALARGLSPEDAVRFSIASSTASTLKVGPRRVESELVSYLQGKVELNWI
ncbi:MAG: carbohydrate kinase family protein [Candidatus Korarchaeum sp.]|nr:carbohydrate kinase family protein [Candidatus Korarchaeum sp.]MDW8036101.1 carbohydrate kinase family protein [Candidatus Korarchaeum sp.]